MVHLNFYSCLEKYIRINIYLRKIKAIKHHFRKISERDIHPFPCHASIHLHRSPPVIDQLFSWVTDPNRIVHVVLYLPLGAVVVRRTLFPTALLPRGGRPGRRSGSFSAFWTNKHGSHGFLSMRDVNHH